MPAHLLLFLHGWRHAIVGIAVVAVLAMALRIHPHAADGSGHGEERVASVQANPGDPPADPQAPDATCDCLSVSALAADTLALPPAPLAVAGLRMSHPDDLPDSLSYPPDPPPARLG